MWGAPAASDCRKIATAFVRKGRSCGCMFCVWVGPAYSLRHRAPELTRCHPRVTSARPKALVRLGCYRRSRASGHSGTRPLELATAAVCVGHLVSRSLCSSVATAGQGASGGQARGRLPAAAMTAPIADLSLLHSPVRLSLASDRCGDAKRSSSLHLLETRDSSQLRGTPTLRSYCRRGSRRRMCASTL